MECVGRWRGEGVGVGVRRAADSCHGLRHSSVISPLLFTTLLPFDTLPVEIPLKAASYTLISSFSLLSSLPSLTHWLSFSLSFLFTSLHQFSFLSANFATLPLPFFIPSPFSSSSGLTSLAAVPSTLRSVPPRSALSYKMSPSQTFVPVGTCADRLQSFSPPGSDITWQQATGRNTPHIVFPPQQSHHL